MAEGTAAWHRPLHHTRAGALTKATAQTPGMSRYEAISGTSAGSEHIWMGETHVSPSIKSSDHHHGASETAIFVVVGHPVFVFLRDSEEVAIETSPGDYVYVPPFTPHREENPSPGHRGGRGDRPQHAGSDRGQPAEPASRRITLREVGATQRVGFRLVWEHRPANARREGPVCGT